MTFKIGSPTSTAVKICGITQLNQAKAIASIGVDAIGIIGVKESPRFLGEDQRKEMFSQLEDDFPKIKRVFVIADLSDDEIDAILKGAGSPSVVQLHGNESCERCEALRTKHPKIEWWKAIRVQSPNDLMTTVLNYKEHVDAVLLDAWSPSELGGTGQRLPLEWLQQTKLEIPWWLAGGISAESIPEILRQVSPFGIDASSRLETSPGIKDIKKVKDLVSAVKDKITSN